MRRRIMELLSGGERSAGQIAEVVGATVRLDAVEIGAQLGQGLERRRGQQGDLGLGVGLADLLHRGERQHEIPEGSQLDHQDLLDFLAHRPGSGGLAFRIRA